MKIKPEHMAQLRAAIRTVADKVGLHPESERYAALARSPKRFRWDVLHASGLRAGDSVGMQTGWPVYDYADDTHIDTALRAVMREHGIEWAATK